MVDTAVDGYIDAGGGVVHAKPEDTARFGVGIAAHLCYEGEACLLSSGGALVPILHAIYLKTKSSVAQFAAPRTGVGALRDVKRRALILVAHAVFDVLCRHFAVGLDEERHGGACVFASGRYKGLARGVIVV